MSKRLIGIILSGVLVIVYVLYHQYNSQQEMSQEINQMQEKFDDQETAISTVVRVLDEIREEKKAAEKEAKSYRDSLEQTRMDALQLKDSLTQANNALKNEIKHIKNSSGTRQSESVSPLEQRYRSGSKGDTEGSGRE